MGGIGSGGWQVGKVTTSALRSLDVRRLHRNGLLFPGTDVVLGWEERGAVSSSIRWRASAGCVAVSYGPLSTGVCDQFEYVIPIDVTPCTYGGTRAWFHCPAHGCGRRVAKLYLGRNMIFACRCCHRLVYASQRETCGDRGIRAADGVRARLGWPPGILNPPGRKPRGMHWATFDNLLRGYEARVAAALVAHSEWVTRFKKREGTWVSKPAMEETWPASSTLDVMNVTVGSTGISGASGPATVSPLLRNL